VIKAVLLDDEKHANQSLHRLIDEHCPQIEICEIFTKPIDFIHFAENEHIDVLFLDIKMPGKSGFEVLELLGPVSFKIIFVTAFDHFAIKAFKYAAFDYILKPVVAEELVKTVERLSIQTLQEKQQEKLHYLTEILKSQTQITEKLVIPSVNGYDFVYQKDIIHCQADRNYSTVTTTDRQITCSRPLKDLEDLLDSSKFIRIHNSHIVNKDFVPLKETA
jgi:two-component system LytT family response regulator